MLFILFQMLSYVFTFFIISPKRFPNFLILFHTFSNSFLLFPRSFPGLGFSNSNVLFLYYFIVSWHRRSMGQKLGAARGAPKRHLHVISWALACDIVRGGRPLKSTKKQWINKAKSAKCAIKENSLGHGAGDPGPVGGATLGAGGACTPLGLEAILSCYP